MKYRHGLILTIATFVGSAYAAPEQWGQTLIAPAIAHPIVENDDFLPITRAKDSDPLEALNRSVYTVNKSVDTLVLKPVATAYKSFVPSFARQGVNNFLSYLHTPADVVNYALQGNGTLAGNAMGRLVINTFGLGLFDIASEAGISRKQTGIGETLGVLGAPQGPYVVLPVFGGRSWRGTIGTFGDAQFGGVGELEVNERNTLFVLGALDTRSRLLGVDDVVSGAALDEYSFVRDSLIQRETSRIEELKN